MTRPHGRPSELSLIVAVAAGAATAATAAIWAPLRVECAATMTVSSHMKLLSGAAISVTTSIERLDSFAKAPILLTRASQKLSTFFKIIKLLHVLWFRTSRTDTSFRLRAALPPSQRDSFQATKGKEIIQSAVDTTKAPKPTTTAKISL